MFKRIFDINLVGAGGANSWNYSTFVFSGRIMFWFREKCFNMNWIWAAHKWTWSSERWLLKFSSRTSPNSYSGEIVLNERWTGLYHMIIGHQLNGYCDVVSILQYWYWHCDVVLILWYCDVVPEKWQPWASAQKSEKASKIWIRGEVCLERSLLQFSHQLY